MAEGSSSNLYRNSAAAGISLNSTGESTLPRTASTHSFRAPFLSPASRPTSSLWSPPNYSGQLVQPGSSPNGSSTALPLKSRAPLPSTRLQQKLEASDKPWLEKPDRAERLSWWITVACMLLGIIGAAGLCYLGATEVKKLSDNQLCLVLDEEFNGDTLDDSTWSRDIELGGFGNGEFQMTTNENTNLYIQNSQLYIHPTLTTDDIPDLNLFSGNYTLQGCTTNNHTACSTRANTALGAVINPIRSARINTKGKKSIKYGKVEIRAKLPRGDWLWPAVWMLPDQNTYGDWPLSGEIDILEARGNSPSYPAQGSNYVRSSLNYGPLPSLFRQIFGWFSMKRSSFDKAFHTYALEWDESFMRFYTDTRVTAMLDLDLAGRKDGFWDRGQFPLTAQNGSAQVVVENPWQGGGKNAPYDQSFYLIIDLAAGGTSGWFPDGVGNKSWYDGSLTAMRDFARAQDTWSKTWPASAEDRSFRIDYVKMWKKC
ncbi:glycoside hydrolase family 16 protein [Macrolepiota fuliginosa MF-IS2]|uniref:Glycoside hydrolase family 16 protein n=1 Tax=Macrolepiota fuliginosa MF-IS2 TaxID=1400762 RepID=A0A9P5X9S5_9AGAR|nr:glycoside hydrolase family 16 protein [Macrolepiota fuliginosa MF-IS2]